ncbi:MAG: hypothetical protein ACE5GU_13000 [Candidatus Scalinduaceae bacterium]
MENNTVAKILRLTDCRNTDTTIEKSKELLEQRAGKKKVKRIEKNK